MRLHPHGFAVVLFLLAALVLSGCASHQELKQDVSTDSASQHDLPSRDVLDHVIAASLYETQGEYLRALHEYRRALLRDSSRAELYQAGAEMHERLGELESAELLLNDGVRKTRDLNLFAHLGELQFEIGHDSGAAATYQQMLDVAPDDFYAKKQLALAYERLGRTDDALAMYDSMLKSSPEDIEPILMRKVMLLSSLERYDEALEVYEQLREEKPDAARFPFFISGLYLDMGDTTSAAESIATATHLRPVEPRYWEMRIRIEVVRGNTDQALALIDSAVSYNPGSPELHSLAAALYLQNNMNDRAEAALRHTLELEPTEPEHYINLGFLLHEEEKWEEAEELYRNALKLAPGDAQLLNNYAYLLAEQGIRLEEALEYSIEAVSMEPENSSYLDTRGYILYRLDRYEEAQKFLERAAEISPEHHEILGHLGDLYQAMDQMEKARKMWRKAMEAGGDEDEFTRKLEQE